MSRTKHIQFLKKELNRINNKIDTLIIRGKDYAELAKEHARVITLINKAEQD